MKYEYKVTTAQGMNTLAVDGWRVVAMYMNSIIMEREIKEIVDDEERVPSNKTASGRARKTKGANQDGK